MDGKLKVLRRKSKKGGMYDALVHRWNVTR